MLTPSIASIGNISEEWFDRMAPRTSASALGMTFVKEELEPEEKLAQVAKEENWGSEKTEGRQEEEKGEKNALRLTLETMSINKSQVIITWIYMVLITCLECRIGCKSYFAGESGQLQAPPGAYSEKRKKLSGL